MKIRPLACLAVVAASIASSAHAQEVVFFTGSDNGFFTPFNPANATTVKYGDSGWLGGPDALPVALGRITLGLATFNGPVAGTVDIELTINDGDPSGLVFGSGAELYRTVIEDVELPASTSTDATFFELSVPLPSVMTLGGFNNVGWSVSLRNYQYQGQLGFQVATCKAQFVGFYTNNASFFNGNAWSLFAFGADTCTQIAQYTALIELAEPASCPADLNDDGFVNGEDLGLLLGNWGPCTACTGDFNDDGFVNGEDLGILLGGWGECPA